MPRVTLDETSPSCQQARSAAIAAMGQRLAAAGPRTRQLVTQRYHPLIETEQEELDAAMPRTASEAPVLVADRSHAFIRDIAPILPPSPRRRLFTAIGRAGALAVMASAGFALVLVAQSPRWSAGRHEASRKTTAVAAAAPQPAQMPPPASPSTRAESVAQPAVPPVVAPSPAMRTPPPPQPAATPSKPVPAAPVSAPARHPLQVELALARWPRQEVRKPLRMAVRHAALPTQYELPRWLTEDRPLIMSPPPHDLEVPAEKQAEKQRPALPPLPRPRLIYASAAYPPPNLPYYGPVYPYGYNQPPPYPR